MGDVRDVGTREVGMGPAAVALEGVWVGYGPVAADAAAVRGVDLRVPAGRCLALIGDSGSGKSTMLAVLAGLLRPWLGAVRLDGRDVTDVEAHQRSVNLVFQDGALFPFLSVAGNIAFGPQRRNTRTWRDRGWRTRAANVMSEVGLDVQPMRRPKDLSGGQAQRVALLRALVNDPAVLLLDEPFRGLDRHLRDALVQRVRRLVRTRRRTVVIATHDIDELWPVADLLAVIEGGVIAQVDRPEQVYRHPTTMSALQLTGDCLPFYSAVADRGWAARLAAEPAWARPDSVTVRPADVRGPRRPREPDDEIVVPATLAGVRQVGPSWQHDLIYPDGRVVSWRSATAPTAPPGRVEVTVPVASLLRPQPRATGPDWPEPADRSDEWNLDLEPNDGRGRPAPPLTTRMEILDSRADR